MPRTSVSSAVATVEALEPDDDGSAEAAMREKLALRYNTVRPFLSLLGESDALDAAPAGRRMVKAVRRLPALSRRRVKDRPLLPREVDAELVTVMWKRAVFSNTNLPQGSVDRDAYVVCVLEQLHRALNRRDVFAAPSNRWADPRARLLDGPRWEAMRGDVLAGLSLAEDADGGTGIQLLVAGKLQPVTASTAAFCLRAWASAHLRALRADSEPSAPTTILAVGPSFSAMVRVLDAVLTRGSAVVPAGDSRLLTAAPPTDGPAGGRCCGQEWLGAPDVAMMGTTADAWPWRQRRPPHNATTCGIALVRGVCASLTAAAEEAL